MTDLKLKPKQKNHNMFLKSLPEGYLHFENIKSAFTFETRDLRTRTQPPLNRMELGPWNKN